MIIMQLSSLLERMTAGEIGFCYQTMHQSSFLLTIDEVRVKRTDSDTHVDWIAVNGGIMEVRDNVLFQSLLIVRNV